MMQQIYPVTPHPYSFEINKDFHFAAAHYIAHDDAGKCKHTHGHTYFVNITIAGDELDHTGFLVDFKAVKNLIHKRFDHGLLNDDQAFSDDEPNYFPTTEVIARTIYEVVQAHLNTLANQPACIQVYLRETPTSYCVYRPGKGDKE
ncbi:6-carboxytetrahydropterin synthase QueD [Virgibacillus phasianinus]|uniref:6-carboxy-5,6,7,8-tetrahydropterin synthase n=1 Tax=Virgibacillus phasianinus TaxID=2017483 RepID=A0A220U370_9BACI|nr:6-carboxytetrahydropterin synthase QueD [Virgibacillus phasianinus]ASK62537.1 6-carboxytetrahydropterin synthase QueD [Virgibacillus phasianinus]